jgi:hypothetical protein
MKLDPSRPIVRIVAMVVGALLAASITTGAWAQWKWRDGSGRVQYSDLPPPAGVSEQQILQRPNGAGRAPAPATQPEAGASAAGVSANAASAPKGTEPELEAKRRKAEEDEKAKKKAEEAKAQASKAENCARAQANMRALNDGMRMARVNAKGEREVLDDAARAAETKRTRDVMSTDCKK